MKKRIHPADIADILRNLPSDKRKPFFDIQLFKLQILLIEKKITNIKSVLSRSCSSNTLSGNTSTFL